jgi:hypothetical protein
MKPCSNLGSIADYDHLQCRKASMFPFENVFRSLPPKVCATLDRSHQEQVKDVSF